MIERWRCFVAVPLPDDLRSALADVVRAWRDEADRPDLRWTDPAGWHLTLAFLGWIEGNLVGQILTTLRATASEARVAELVAGGLGAFPSPRRARVLWYRVSDAGGAALVVTHGIRCALAPIVPRVEEASPFRPHVTLARARAERGVDLSSWIAGRAVPSGVVPLERVILYRSHPGRGPAQYQPLGAVTVGAGARIVRDLEAEASVDG
jgi:RNA 2',3'-cyclic 3'-phosphodiesterase